MSPDRIKTPARPGQLLPITAVVLTYQSERTLKPVLASLQWCDEIIVVDSGSTDSTIRICEEMRATIHHRKLDGFGPQKQFAVSRARNDWVFVCDSDEVVTEALRDEIVGLFEGEKPLTFGGFQVPVQLIFLGRPMRFSGTWSYPLRLFHRGRARYTAALVHETVDTQNPVGRLSNGLKHYSYLSIEDYLKKFNVYTTLGAEELHRKGRKISLVGLWFRFPTLFFRRFILQLGILDGHLGLLWSLMSALYPVIKYLKLRELRQPCPLPAESGAAQEASS